MKILIFVLLFLASSCALGDTVNGSFNAPTEREDGTPLAIDEIAEHRLYIDDVLNQSIANTDTSFTVNLEPGVYDFKMTTVDTDGRESKFSDVLRTNIPAPPGAPQMITITVTITVTQ